MSTAAMSICFMSSHCQFGLFQARMDGSCSNSRNHCPNCRLDRRFYERGEVGRAGARGVKAGALPVPKADLIKTVAVVDYLFDCLEIDDAFTGHSNERRSSEPCKEIAEHVVGRVFVGGGVNPSAPISTDCRKYLGFWNEPDQVLFQTLNREAILVSHGHCNRQRAIHSTWTDHGV